MIDVKLNLVISYCALHRNVSAERVGQGEVGGVTRTVVCTWQLLSLGAKRPWLTLSEPILTPGVRMRLEKAILTF